MVATLVQQGDDDCEESIEVRVEVTLQVSGQLHDQAEEKWLMSSKTLESIYNLSTITDDSIVGEQIN